MWLFSSSGALLKACFCFLDIVTLPSNEKLSEQLSRKYQAGFELHTWSTAPQGSGLGTSSILAGVILAALLRATGRTASMDSLIHAVLIIEQMLTTGGGWQDNVGGLLPGFKMTRSQASLPLKVDVEALNLPQETVDAVTQRLICVYSGKPRLAKNLLQVHLIKVYLGLFGKTYPSLNLGLPLEVLGTTNSWITRWSGKRGIFSTKNILSCFYVDLSRVDFRLLRLGSRVCRESITISIKDNWRMGLSTSTVMYREAGTVQWWECSPPTNVAWVRFRPRVIYNSSLSLLFVLILAPRVFRRVLWFSSLHTFQAKDALNRDAQGFHQPAGTPRACGPCGGTQRMRSKWRALAACSAVL